MRLTNNHPAKTAVFLKLGISVQGLSKFLMKVSEYKAFLVYCSFPMESGEIIKKNKKKT